MSIPANTDYDVIFKFTPVDTGWYDVHIGALSDCTAQGGIEIIDDVNPVGSFLVNPSGTPTNKTTSKCLAFIETCDPTGTCETSDENCKISGIVWILGALLAGLAAMKSLGGKT